MKLREAIQINLDAGAINKKLQALCARLQRAIVKEGYDKANYSVSVQALSNQEVELRVEYQFFLSAEREHEFLNDIEVMEQLAERIIDHTSFIDESYFGGSNTRIIKRGAKINCDSLMSDIHLLLRLPANRHR